MKNGLALRVTVYDAGHFKGEVSWSFFISFVRNDEIRPSITCQIILE